MKLIFFLTWSVECIIVTRNVDNQIPRFAIADSKLYVPVVTLSAQDNAKLFQQLHFKRTINWNIYQSELKITKLQAQNQYLDYLIHPSFQGVNRLFILSFENNAHQRSYKQYFLSTVEIENYNVMIDGKKFLDQPVKNKLRTYENIRKIETGKGDDYTTGCFLDYNCFENYYNMIAIDLSEEQALDADPKPIQQINFIANLD